MNRWMTAGTAAALMAGGAAQAQDIYYWPTAAAPAQTAQVREFPMGTPLTLITRIEVNTKQAKPGDRLYLTLAEPLSYRGQVVIPAGSPAVAEVARSERNGHFGKKGAIEIRLLYVQTPNGPVKLTGGLEQRGKGAGWWSIGGMVVTGSWAMALIHGTSGYIRHDTPVAATLAEPLRFREQVAVAAAPTVTAIPDTARPLPASFDYNSLNGTVTAAYRPR